MKIRNVLSLFGWIEWWMMALESLGIVPERYFSSEIDPYPIENTKHNYPDIVHIGSVTDISYKQKTGAIHFQENWYEFIGEIDLLIGWSPCQDVSNAGNQKGLAWTYEEYLEQKKAGTATRSDLFWEFIRILGETKPKYFMLENVKMKQEYMDIFNKAVGFEWDLINAALLSPQNRKRVYFCGKLNPDGTYSKVSIPQPKDAGMKLKDILEGIPFDAVDDKGNPIWKPVPDKYIPLIKEREKALSITATYWNVCPKNFFEKWEREIVILQIPHGNNNGHTFDEKVPSITTSKWQDNNKLVAQEVKEFSRFYQVQYMWRPLTVRECARCQWIPDSYEFVTSKSRSYKCIGNGWEARTVAHVFKHLFLA